MAPPPLPSAIMWCADDWAYVAEGGQHIVCRSNKGCGKVLRLRKRLQSSPSACNNSHDAADDAVEVIWRAIFGRQVVLESLRVPLEETFLTELSRRIEPYRPVHRRHASIDTTARHGQLLDDASQLLPPACEDVVTVELKVKCGLKSSSPFTPLCRGVKRRLGRYQLMQLYKQSQNAAEGRAVSLYDPCLLCSGDEVLVKQALQALVASPQNNLLLSLNGQSCAELAKGDSRGKDEQWDAALLIEAVSSILVTSDILPRLQMVQSLDFIDIEGASLIFARLERELGSKHAAEQAVLESFGRFDYTTHDRLVRLIQAQREPGDAVVGSWRSIPAGISPMEVLFYLRLDQEDEEKGEGEDDGEKRRLASAFLDGCSRTDCLELLQYWLLALTAKDASLMITLAIQQPGPETLNGRGPCQGTIAIAPKSGGAAPIRLLYSMGLVDMGIKHPRKCWSKGDQEESILQAISKSL